jgi:hypothetical protein
MIFSLPAFFPFELPSFAQLIQPVPTAGDSTVTITFSSALANAATGQLYSNGKVSVGAQCVASAAYVLALKSGVSANAPVNSTSLVLTTNQPLSAGTMLCAVLSGAGGAVVVSTPVVQVQTAAAPPGFDWGLVRAYFTAGALTSQEQSQFSHEDLFLAFRLDKVYWTNADSAGNYKPRLSSFFETRLTSLPVAVQNCNASTSTSACSSSSSTSTSTSATTPSTTSQTFLNSQKSALLQFGVYYPIFLNTWTINSRIAGGNTPAPYGLFLAPILKMGFDTALDGLNVTQQQSNASSQVQSIGNSSQFYKFYEGGFRLGHDGLSSNAGEAAEQISYADVGWGRFSNLSSLLCPVNEYQGNNSCNALAGTLPWQRDLRLHVEGLLQIPATKGFSVGFGSNVSFHPASRATASAPIHIQPSDDLRFLFAYQFDITTIASKLAPQLTP